MTDSSPMVWLFCVCEEEWCYCVNRVGVQVDARSTDVACDACEEGRHVWSPGGERQAAHAREGSRR